MGEDVNDDDAVPPDWLLAQIADLRQAATDLREMHSRSEWQKTVDNPPWRQWEWVDSDGGASGALTKGPAGWKIDLVDGDRKAFMRALESASDIADEIDNYVEDDQ